MTIGAKGSFGLRDPLSRRHSGVSAMIAAIVLILPGAAYAADACSASDRAAAEPMLMLTPQAQAQAVARVFPWGPPSGATAHERQIVQRDYVIAYDDDLLGPVWSADMLGDRKLAGGRIDCFRADPRIPKAVASTPKDFEEPIFDQGHMVPNGDMSFDIGPGLKPGTRAFDRVAVMNSFVMSNMSPQFCQFNRGVWQILETFVRGWALQHKPLYVINGAVFDRDGDLLRDADEAAVRMLSKNGQARVAVPSMYYKILAFVRDDGTLDTLTILLPHDQVDVDKAPAVAYLDDHVSNLAAVEAITGLKFFPTFGGARAEALHIWDISGVGFQSLVNDQCRTNTGGAHLVGSAPRHYQVH